MKITIDHVGQFRDAFHKANRQNQFSYEALGLLFDYFEEDEDMELDVIGLCCEFVEMSEEEVRDSYHVSSERDITNFLQENTLYIGKTSAGDFVFAQF